MLKMLKLDWSAIKCCHIILRLLLIVACFLVTGWFSTIWLVPEGVFWAFCFSINPFAAEEAWNLNRLYLTLPISRSRVVACRYLLSLILFLAGTILALALMPLTNLYSFSKWYPDLKWSLALVSFGFLIHALLSLFMYPILFRLGYRKGHIWGFYLPVLLTGVVYLTIIEYDLMAGGTFILNCLIYASEHILPCIGGMLGLGAVILAGSWLLSMKLYSRRDF